MVEHERTGVVDLVTWSFSRVAMWAPAFIVLIILYEVFNRYVLASGTYWVNEMSLWVAGGVYLTAGLYAMQQRSHIRIFVLYDMAPRWLRRVFDVISAACVCIFAAAVVWGGFNEAYAKLLRWERFGTVFDPPIPATIKPLILVLMVVLAVQAISNLIRDWPAAPIVRKAFDVFAFLLILAAVGFGLRFLYRVEFGDLVEQSNIPGVWTLAIGVFLLVVLALAAVGLVRDFNRDPVPVDHHEDPADEIDREALGLEPEGLTAHPELAPEPAVDLANNDTITGNPPIPGKKNHP